MYLVFSIVLTYHSRASKCLQNIRGTDLGVVFVLILFPQMSNIFKGAILTSATMPWHWLFFASPRSHALKICLEIMIP